MENASSTPQQIPLNQIDPVSGVMVDDYCESWLRRKSNAEQM